MYAFTDHVTLLLLHVCLEVCRYGPFRIILIREGGVLLLVCPVRTRLNSTWKDCLFTLRKPRAQSASVGPYTVLKPWLLKFMMSMLVGMW